MAERANTEAFYQKITTVYLMRFDGNEQAIRQNLHLLQVSHGQPSTNFVKNLKTVVIFQKKHRFLIPPLAICWALPWALEKSR